MEHETKTAEELQKSRVTRFALIFGAIIVLGTAAVGYQAYISSRDALLNAVYKSNLELARAFRDHVGTMGQLPSNANVMDDLKSLWKGIDRPFKGGFLCVVDKQGVLTLHTETPQREGVFVGDNPIGQGKPGEPRTLNELIAKKKDWVGPYLSSAGVPQVAAFSYVPAINAVVSVHVPFQEIENTIHKTTLPWILGLLIIGGGLVPFSMFVVHRAYIGAHRKLRDYNKILNAEIHERKQAEAALEKHRGHLEELVAERTTELTTSNRELETFCYSVSHDLRAPLRAIDGFSHILLGDYADKLDDSGQDHLARIRTAAQHMAVLIDELLQLSRVSRMEMEMVDVDLSSLAMAVVAELKDADPARAVDVTIAPDLHAYGDKTLLASVITNLLNNAWKFTGKKAHVQIEFGHENTEHGPAFFVRDNGAGFDMQFAAKLFTVFERLHTPEEFEGSGVGLATVQRIITRHGGKIWAEAEQGKGATFYFALPRKTQGHANLNRAAANN